MTNYKENTEENKSIARKLLASAYEGLKKLTAIELVIFFLNIILAIIIFTGGVKTMIVDVVKAFPIPSFLHIPIGFSLMVILVAAAKLLTQHLAEMCFSITRYSKSYKIILPITWLCTIIFCWGVQSEASDITTDEEMEQQLASIVIDSTNLNQIDQSIAQINSELDSATKIISSIESKREKRNGGWMSQSELTVMPAAQETKRNSLAQLTSLTDKRVMESERLNGVYQKKKEEILQQKEKDLNKGRSKAGAAELLLVLATVFTVAFRQRWKVEEVELNNAIDEFEKGLSIDQKEELLPSIKPLDYDEEEAHLLIELQGVRKYFDIPKLIKHNKEYHRRFEKAKSSESQDTQLRNIAFSEQILAMTPLQIDDLERVYGYKPLNLDYWNSTTGNVSPQFPDAWQKRNKNVLPQSDTVVPHYLDST